MGRAFGARVDGTAPVDTPSVWGFLRWTGLTAGGSLSLTAPTALRVADCP